MMGFLPFLLVGVTGWLLLVLLRRGEPLRFSCGSDLPLCFGSGAVLLHLEFLLASWGGAVGLWQLGLVPLLLFVPLCWRWRGPGLKNQGDSALATINWPLWGGVAILLGVQIFILLPTLALPLFDWEGRMLWVLKSRFLEESASVLAEPFRDPYRLHIHPRYPLLVPWLTSVVARAAGGFRELHYLLVILTFALLTTWQLYLALARRLGWRIAMVIGLMLVLSSSWYTAAINHQVEIVLAFFLLAALLRIMEWFAGHRRRDLVLAAILLAGGAMTKNEGLLLALTVCLASGMATIYQERQRLIELGILPGLFFILYLPWFLQQRMIPAVADENYLSRLNFSGLQSGLERLPLILRTIGAEMVDWEYWHLFWLIMPLLVLGSLIRWRQIDPARQAVSLVWVGYFCGLLLIYILSPWQDISLHINSSFDRVILPLVPCSLLLLGLWYPANRSSARKD